MAHTASDTRPVVRIAEVRDAVRQARASGRRIGFVPTMGFLHDGHLALIDDARRHADYVVLSIFVNPLQFGPSEDFGRYPRDVSGDLAKAGRRGVDLVFLPEREEMYGEHRAIEVVPTALHFRWEGASRPGHFAGVLTVVAKLFNIVQPDVAVFGQKDVQQCTLVRALVRDLDFPVELIIAPTVRERDGLAMSSRNSYLSPSDRQRALALSRALHAIVRAHQAGESATAALIARGRAILDARSLPPDYLAIVDAETLEPRVSAAPGDLAIVAARVGTTRLIDNAILGRPIPGIPTEWT